MIMLLSVVLAGQAGILRNALNGRGYTFVSQYYCEAGALIVSLSGMTILPRIFGVEGAAIATVLGAIARFLILLFNYRKHVGPVGVREMLPTFTDILWCLRIFYSIFRRVH